MKKIFNLIIGVVLATTACTNLDENLYSEMSKDEFLGSGENLALYISTPYTRLQEWGVEQGYWTLILQLSNEVACPKSWDGHWGESRYGELQTHEIPVSNKLVRTGWEFCFNGIAACNDALHEIEKAGIEGDAVKANIAEIKVLRAYYYFLAIDLWGGVPYSVDKKETGYPEVKDREFMFSFIESEIKENLEYLTATPSAESYGRVTRDMANFLLAKLYLNAEVYIGKAMWKEAGDVCKQIMDSGHYSLTSTFKENFQVHNESSTEAIFAIPYSNIYTPNSFYIYVLTLNPDSEAILGTSGATWNGTFMGQPDFMATYDANDTRKKDTWLYGDIYDSKGKRVQYQDGVDSNKNPIMVDYTLEDVNIPEANFGKGLERGQGARIQKWTYQNDGTLKDYSVSMENDFILMRYSDVVLMYVEALVRQNKVSEAAAVSEFQQIRERAGLEPMTAGELTLDNLLIERQHEMCLEGWTRNDLVRFGKYLNAWWAKPAGKEHMLLLPIPDEMRGSNPNLGQNPGY